MSIEKNKHLIRRYYEKLWNRWDLTVAEELIHAEITFRGSLGIDVQSLDGFKAYMSAVRAAFPDFHNTIEELIAEEDQVAARLTYRGTHKGALFGIAPTGRQITYAGVAIFRVRGGKIVEGWVLGDRLALIEQLRDEASSGSLE